MGLLAKVMQFKENREAVKTAALPRSKKPGRVLTLNGERSVLVVGGEYMPKHSQKVPTDVELAVELRREPKNTHDKNAIMVLYKGHAIGYFSSFNAAKYASLIDIANRNGQTVQATATAERDHRGGMKTTVEMPTAPTEATLKQLSKYQDQLIRVLAGMEERNIKANIVLDETPSGKYKGQNMVKFFSQGDEIGVLPAQYREAHQEFFRAAESGKTDCMVLIRRYDERLWARATIY